MSLTDFFESEEVETTVSTPVTEQKNREKVQEPVQDRPVPTVAYEPQRFEVGQDIEDIFLLDVQYNGPLNLAQLVFYHEDSQSLYRWNDTTGHKPYLITMMSREGVESIDKVVNSSEFLKIESTTKFYPLEQQEMELLKVYGTNPLAIGGKRGVSFREFIDPSFEADIRYHFNYIADMQLTPGTYYRVIEGQLQPIAQEIGEVRRELEAAFAEEPEEEKEMLEEYMPLLFQRTPDILRCAYDIEVGSEEGRMPNPNVASDQVISIALVDSQGRRICWVLNRSEVEQEAKNGNVDIRRHDSERELLLDFFEVVNTYPIALSFNGDNFDNPYLMNRAKNLGITEVPLRRKGRTDTAFDDALHIDLHLFFRQASIRIYAFGARYDSASLDELSTTLLGEGKLEHPEVWIDEMDLATLVKYNVKDAELTLRLTQFDSNVVLDLIFILMRISKMPIFDFTRTAVSGWLQMWLIYEHRKRNYLIPRKEDILAAKGRTATSAAIIEGKKFQGAIVLEPKPGIWWDVHVLDFASLYPSIIKTRNLSYETILCAHEECKSNVVPELGHYTCTKQLGLFAIILGFVRDTRVKWFKPRASNRQLPELERRNNNVIQSSLKVLINAGYGVLGSEAFDFYCPPVAESTTAYARDAITSTKDYVENTLHVDVLYGDTDSVFLLHPSEKQIEDLLEWGLANVGVELGTDYVFRYVVFSDRKKNYFGITKSGSIIVKGLMGKKSNTPQIVRDHFDLVLDVLRNVNTPEEFPQARKKIVNRLKSMVKRLETGDFDASDISIKLSLSKRLKEYSTWTQTIQVAAQLIGTDRYQDDISVGTTLEFIKVEPFQIIIPDTDKLAFQAGDVQKVSVKPVELIDPEVDLDGQPVIEIAESTFSQILSSIGSSWNEVMGIKSLDDFF